MIAQICGRIDGGSGSPESEAMETAGTEAQAAGAVMLVRPACFGFNAEAAASNVFSRASADPGLQLNAAAEFESVARALADAGVEVLILDDSAEPAKPDAVFPNNWFSTHADGTLVLYPMATAARRPDAPADSGCPSSTTPLPL